MELFSPAFENNQLIPPKFTCDGSDVSPALQIKNVPPEAQSLVLIVDDPDASKGDWVHWSVYNISPSVTEIAEDTVPEGEQGMTDFGKPGYGGPCPAQGLHHYQFKLYALRKKLSFKNPPTKKELEEAMGDYIIERATLVGQYSRETKNG